MAEKTLKSKAWRAWLSTDTTMSSTVKWTVDEVSLGGKHNWDREWSFQIKDCDKSVTFYRCSRGAKDACTKQSRHFIRIMRRALDGLEAELDKTEKTFNEVDAEKKKG